MAPTPLADRLKRVIAQGGPIPLAQFIHLAMADPVHGYYTSRETIGADGDFITAPEISQMFGELLGMWCAGAWQAIGAPSRFTLAEAGPGNGTLMADLLRATRSVEGFNQAATLRLIETSPPLRRRQAAKLEGTCGGLAFADGLEALGEDRADGPVLLLANEFLDVLPLRQYVKSGPAWLERCIGLDPEGNLAFVLGTALASPGILPHGAASEPDGSVFEHSPAREAWTQSLASILAHRGGAGLLIDYGHAYSAFGDTFQAMRAHGFVDPLAEPGMADLTSHVDFAALARSVRSVGAIASPVITQGEFLLSMGLAQRAGTLGSGKDEATQAAIRSQAERLVAPGQMGNLFKVMAIAAHDNHASLQHLPPIDRNPATEAAD